MTMTHLLVTGGLVALVALAWLFWPRIQGLFADSETLFFGRLQMLVGALMTVDLSPVVPSKYMGLYVIATGLITEMARRSRADDL